MVDDVVLRLRDAAVSVSSGLELDAVLQHVVDAAARLLDARYAALGVLDKHGGLSTFVTSGFDGDAERIGHHPRGEGILGLLIRDPRPLRMADLTEHPESVGFPAGHPSMRSFVGVPIRVRDRVYGNLYVTENREGDFSEGDEQLAIALAAMAGAAIDNALLYGETRRREQSLDALRQISGEIVSGSGVDRVIELVADRARELIGAALAVICVPRSAGDDSDLEIRAVSSAGPTAVERGAMVTAADSLAGEVMRRGRLVAAAWQPIELAPAMEAGSGNTAMGVPLLVSGQPFGALTLAVKDFGDEQRRLTETFANHASVMLAYSRTRDEVDRLLLIEERERIGRDLHDTVIQRLFAAGLELQALVARHGQQDPELSARLGRAIDGLDTTISQIRATIFALQPPELAVGTTRAVEAARLYKLAADIVDESARALGFTPDLLVPGDPTRTVPGDIAAHMLTVLREALSNVARHARATSVVVEVEIGEQCVVRATDDGVGVPADAEHLSHGHGLRNMRERARAVGGEFVIDSVPDGGTVLEWCVQAS